MKARAWELAYCWGVLQALDVVTTAAALGFGAVEVNPAMMGDPWRMVAIKVGVSLAVLGAAFVVPARAESAAKAGLVAGLVFAGGVVAWNVTMLVWLGASL